MVTEDTINKLRKMKLHGMADCYENQLTSPAAMSLSFEERMGLIVDTEQTYQKDRKLQRLLKAAKFKTNACVEDIDFRHSRGLDKAEMASLISGNWINKGFNLIITGPTGCGKTWLGSALGNHNCRQGKSVRFYKLAELLEDLHLAQGDGSYRRLIIRLSKFDLLIIDDFGICPIDASARTNLLEVIDARTEQKSTLITSQIPVAEWHKYLRGKNATVADAFLDRVLGAAIRLELSGESMRRNKKL